MYRSCVYDARTAVDRVYHDEDSTAASEARQDCRLFRFQGPGVFVFRARQLSRRRRDIRAVFLHSDV